MPTRERRAALLRGAARKPPAENPPAALSCTLAVKVVPNAPRSEVAGWLGDTLKIRIHAPPVDGRANDALCAHLAATLRVHRRAIAILHGESSRQKVVRIDGLTLDRIRTLLSPCIRAQPRRPPSRTLNG